MTPTDTALLPLFLTALQRHGRITFVLAENLGSNFGAVELDHGMIILDARNTIGQMAATIGHELVHLTDDDLTDDDVERRAAEVLIPLELALAGAASGDLIGVAEACGVDVQLVRARLRPDPHTEG